MSEQQKDLTGDFINEYCPKCGASLLKNQARDKWCSQIGCDYSLKTMSEQTPMKEQS